MKTKVTRTDYCRKQRHWLAYFAGAKAVSITGDPEKAAAKNGLSHLGIIGEILR
jgi:hypothetical protein